MLDGPGSGNDPPADEDADPVDVYEDLADSYRESVEGDAYNEAHEFPGTTSLIPDVDGDRVLDAACGTGRYTEWLLESGAEVVGFDASEAMLDRARDRVGDRASFHNARLEEPLEFATDDAFDGVVCGLALDYVPDWSTPLSKFARVLAPGGFLVLSVGHPFDEWPLPEGANYFDTERREREWDVSIPYYRRPLGAMLNPLLDAGFCLSRVHEPQPTEEFANRQPERYETERREPVFLCLRARLPSSTDPQ